jgi:iron complex transport system ATP-binding protein
MKLTIDNITVEIESRPIVNTAHLIVNPGEFVGLVGPNGSGKSTLLRTLYRAIRPTAGAVWLDGDDAWKLSSKEAARRTAVVAQETYGDFDFTVFEVVLMGRTPHKQMFERDQPQDIQLAAQALDRVQLIGFDDRLFATLSGGEKQRVLVARALTQQPRLLVLDEPTNHLDIRFQLEVLELVHGLGITTLVTLHDLNLAAAYCDRIYLLSEGHVVASGTPAEVLTPQRIHQVYGVQAVCGQHPVTGCLQLSFMSQSVSQSH